MSLKADLMNSGLTVTTETQTVNTTSAEVTKIAPVETAPQQRKAPLVMFALPSGRTWESRTATSVVGLAVYTAMQGIGVGIINLEGSMISKQRNDLVKMAKKNGADYMHWIDTDLTFPFDSLIRLKNHDKDVVGATYNKRVPPYETLGRLKGVKPSEEELSKGGIWEAEQLPGGFNLIKMSVYEKIAYPWYYECYQWPGADGVEAFKNMMRDYYSCFADEEALKSIEGTPFANWLNAVHKIESQHQWEVYSEDLSFCRKCIKAGIQLWCDLSLSFQLVHLGTHEVSCRPPQTAPKESVIVNAVM